MKLERDENNSGFADYTDPDGLVRVAKITKSFLEYNEVEESDLLDIFNKHKGEWLVYQEEGKERLLFFKTRKEAFDFGNKKIKEIYN